MEVGNWRLSWIEGIWKSDEQQCHFVLLLDGVPSYADSSWKLDKFAISRVVYDNMVTSEERRHIGVCIMRS